MDVIVGGKIMEFTDETLMPFGIHKNKPLSQVPDKYLLDFYNAKSRGEVYGDGKKLYDYIENNLDAIKSNIKNK